jgi:major membrane immunogen (membrane-anchored lipoprotein)
VGEHGYHGNLKAQSQKYQQVKADKKGIMQNTGFHHFSNFLV